MPLSVILVVKPNVIRAVMANAILAAKPSVILVAKPSVTHVRRAATSGFTVFPASLAAGGLEIVERAAIRAVPPSVTLAHR